MMEPLVISDGPLEESTGQRRVRYNFLFSVGVVVFIHATALLGVARNPEVIDRYYYGGYGFRAVTGTFMMIIAQVMVWWSVYRRAGNPARLLAAVFGCVLLAEVVVQVGRASIDVPTRTDVTLALLYATGSHFLYSMFGSRLRMF